MSVRQVSARVVLLNAVASLHGVFAVQISLGAAVPGQAEEKRDQVLTVQERDRPATTVKEWMAQIEASTVQVTNVRVESTSRGLDITLETAEGKPLQIDATKFRSEGNNLIADIPNAVLALPNATEFSVVNPTGDIANVRVIQVDASSIRVSVVGNNALPKTEVTLKTGAFAYSLNPNVDEPEVEVVVTGEGQQGDRVPNSSVGTLTDTPLRDVPFSIRVIPRQILEEQNVQRVSDALRNVPGVQQVESTQSAFDFLTIRGFGAFGQKFVINGLSVDRYFAGAGIGNVERLEVLRGPASALFSGGEPGGIINIVTKQPLRTPSYSVGGSIGSFNTYSGDIDLTGPLDDKGNILYRLTGYAFSSDTFVDSFNTTRYQIAPVITFRFSENTQLTLEGEYYSTDQPNARGLPARGTVLPNPNGELPINRFLGEPSIDRIELRRTQFGYRFEHRFSEDWQIRNAFNVVLRKQPQNSVFPTQLQADNRTLERGLFIAPDQKAESYIVDTNLVGSFNTGSIEHKILAGFQWKKTVDIPIPFDGSARLVELLPIDIFNPSYGRQNVGSTISEEPDFRQTITNYGIYLQDQISLADNLKLLLGGRFDWSEDSNLSDGVSTSQKDTAFSPRVGIVYQPIKPISLYASYSRSFNPVIGRAADDSLFEPERGTQYEIGVKADISDRLAATLAFFDITRSNVLTDDPADPNFSIQTGEQNSRGIELDISGEVLPGWNIFAGYAYTDARITRDNLFPVGNRLFNAPQNAASLWTTYRIQAGDLKGLGFGLGLFYVGERQGNLGNTFTVPSYLRTDAAIFYEQGQFKAAINIRNLFNVRYFEGSQNILRVFPGEPFAVTGSISWKF